MEEENVFKTKFKYFKRRHPSPDISSICEIPCDACGDVERIRPRHNLDSNNLRDIHVQPADSWQIYHLKSCAGLYYITSALSISDQKWWVKRCLDVYTKEPHVNNTRSVPSDINALRWATLGFHHNWNSKVYSDEAYSEVPKEIVKFSSYISEVLFSCGYTAQACIVNYYTLTSTLSPHSDHSEIDLQQPIISISLGLSCVYLIGGTSLSASPKPLLLHSGDVLVMSGPARMCYHAVARVFHPKTLCQDNHVVHEDNGVARKDDGVVHEDNGVARKDDGVVHEDNGVARKDNGVVVEEKGVVVDGKDTSTGHSRCRMHVQHGFDMYKLERGDNEDVNWKYYQDYIRDRRINLNIRQVLPDGVTSLASINSTEVCEKT